MVERAVMFFIFIGQTVTGYIGCAGVKKAPSRGKFWFCLTCAVVGSLIATVGFAGEGGAFTGKAATWAAGRGGAGAGLIVASVCNLLQGTIFND